MALPWRNRFAGMGTVRNLTNRHQLGPPELIVPGPDPYRYRGKTAVGPFHFTHRIDDQKLALRGGLKTELTNGPIEAQTGLEIDKQGQGAVCTAAPADEAKSTRKVG